MKTILNALADIISILLIILMGVIMISI